MGIDNFGQDILKTEAGVPKTYSLTLNGGNIVSDKFNIWGVGRLHSSCKNTTDEEGFYSTFSFTFLGLAATILIFLYAP